jgi:hypothetical protein
MVGESAAGSELPDTKKPALPVQTIDKPPLTKSPAASKRKRLHRMSCKAFYFFLKGKATLFGGVLRCKPPLSAI